MSADDLFGPVPGRTVPRDRDPQEQPGAGDAPRRRARGGVGCAVAASVAVVVLLVLAVVADGAVRGFAGQKVADAVAPYLADDGAVQTSFSGPLAGLRLVAAQPVTVSVDVTQLQWQDYEADVSVDVRVAGYAATGGTAVLTVPVASLASRLEGLDAEATLKVKGDAVVLTTTSKGRTVKVRCTVAAQDGALVLTPVHLTVAGRGVDPADVPASSPLADLAAEHAVALPTMPDGVSLTSVAVDGDGLVLTLGLDASAFPSITGG